MRRPWRALIGMILVMLIAPPMGEGPAAAGENLLLNGGFEDGKAYWNNVTNIVTTPVHGGAKAASLYCAGSCSIRQLVAVEAGASYSFSAWVYDDAPNVAGVWLSVDWLDADSTHVGSAVSAKLTTDQKAYRALALGPVVAPAPARSARINLWAQSLTGQSGVVTYDDALLLKVGGPPATSSATPMATCTPTATPTRTATRRPANTATRTPAPTGTATATSTGTATTTLTATSTNSPLPTSTVTPTSAPTDTATVTPTDTGTATLTGTATATPTETATATQTATQNAPARACWLPLIRR